MKPHLIVVSPEFCTEESARCLGGRERIAGEDSGYRPLRELTESIQRMGGTTLKEFYFFGLL